jgi:DNA (cytosine-5)-methyltransferase 1
MSLTAKGDSGRMDAESETLITHPLKGEGFDASEDGTGRGTPLVAGALQAGGKTAGSATTQDAMSGLLVPYRKVHRAHDADDGETWDRADVANTLNPHDVGERDTHAIAFHNRQDPNVSGDVTPPLGAADKGLGVLYDGVRRLTPLECERLQGFPDGYTLIEYRGKPAKDGPRYRALGNSMGVPVMRWLGKRIGLVETLCA